MQQQGEVEIIIPRCPSFDLAPSSPEASLVLAKFGRARKCTNLQLVHKPSTHVTLSCHLQWGAQIPGSFPLAVPRGTDAAPWMQSLYRRTYIQ